MRKPWHGTPLFVGTVGVMRRQSEDQAGHGTTGGQPRPRSRPLQAITALILALAAAVVVHLEGVPVDVTTAAQAARLGIAMDIGAGHLITICGTIAFGVLALISTFAFARWARAILERFIGAAYGAIVRYVMILAGICIVALVTLSMLGFRVAQLVVGGAVTGVLITIAAQQSLSNLFAGVMLQFAHPFRVGDMVRVKAGALGGTIEGTVTEFSITYVRLETDEGRVFLPNAQVLAAAIIPLRPADAANGRAEPRAAGAAPAEHAVTSESTQAGQSVTAAESVLGAAAVLGAAESASGTSAPPPAAQAGHQAEAEPERPAQQTAPPASS